MNADDKIRAGLDDVAAGRVSPADDFLEIDFNDDALRAMNDDELDDYFSGPTEEDDYDEWSDTYDCGCCTCCGCMCDWDDDEQEATPDE